MKEKPFSKYQILANAVMIIWTLAIILPFILLFMSSITDENTLVANGYSFFPKKFSLASYSYIIKSGGQILKAYGVISKIRFLHSCFQTSCFLHGML